MVGNAAWWPEAKKKASAPRLHKTDATQSPPAESTLTCDSGAHSPILPSCTQCFGESPAGAEAADPPVRIAATMQPANPAVSFHKRVQPSITHCDERVSNGARTQAAKYSTHVLRCVASTQLHAGQQGARTGHSRQPEREGRSSDGRQQHPRDRAEAGNEKIFALFGDEPSSSGRQVLSFKSIGCCVCSATLAMVF